MPSQTAHALNYARESKQNTLRVRELARILLDMVDAGQGDRPVFVMDPDQGDGLTHAIPVRMCFASEPYDGDVCWLVTG